jgi:hypothetical protein
MKTTHYSFGSITIDDITYSSDVIIFPSSVNPSWWRKEGHLLQKADLSDIINNNISILIIGTGYNGAMRVPGTTIDCLNAMKIEVHICVTSEAVKLYNRLTEKETTATALHLTC